MNYLKKSPPSSGGTKRRRVTVESEGFEPSSRQATHRLSTCLAFFGLSGTPAVKCKPKRSVFPFSYPGIGNLPWPAQKSDAHCTGLMSGTRHRAACPGHLVTGIRQSALGGLCRKRVVVFAV